MPSRFREVSAVQMGLPASSTTDRCSVRAEASRSWSDANPIVLHHIRIDDLVIQGGKAEKGSGGFTSKPRSEVSIVDRLGGDPRKAATVRSAFK